MTKQKYILLLPLTAKVELIEPSSQEESHE